MTKNKPKLNKLPAPAAQSTEKLNNTSDTTANAEQQFEVELYWCIHQLQNALNSGKLSSKQIQDHTKALNILMSKTAPLVQKRQVMRLSFGDYRSKMVAEEKKYTKVNMQVKLTAAKPSPKSIFVKKSICSSADNNFRFNFEVPNSNETVAQDNAEEKMDVQTKSCSNLSFVPSDNSFKFNFDVNN